MDIKPSKKHAVIKGTLRTSTFTFIMEALAEQAILWLRHEALGEDDHRDK
jgi:hypothetical protein